MLIGREHQASLDDFFQTLKLQDHNNESGRDKAAKIRQILAYLVVMYAQLRRYSKRRDLILIECGAGNCYLSFLVYHFPTPGLQGIGYSRIVSPTWWETLSEHCSLRCRDTR